MGKQNEIMIEEFLGYLKHERKLSEHTTYNYTLDIQAFEIFVKKDFREVTYKDVSEYIRQLQKAVTSKNRALSGIKTFYRFLVKEGKMGFNPAVDVESGRVGERIPKPISENDVNKLFRVIKSLNHEAMIKTLYYTGIRRSELCTLKRKDIHIDEVSKAHMYVIGKGNKERLIPIHPQLVKVLRAHLDSHKSSYVFPSPRHKDHISLRHVNTTLENYVNEAGLDKSEITPHKFRHTFCTTLAENNVDVLTIQDLAGHSKTDTTKIYTKIQTSKKSQAVLQAFI